ncbi:MAG: ferrous iron transport protein B, partial [Coriobacteriales bacterium]|nr:ferrous iron transport protein B [Coriobacteriales bacterium]
IHEMIYRDVTVWAWDGSHHHHLKHAPEGYLQLSHEENEIFSAPHYDDEETSSDEHYPTHEQHRDRHRSRRQTHDSHHQRNHNHSERENRSEHESHPGDQPIDEPQDQPLPVAQPLSEQSETEWLRDEHSIDEQKRERSSADRHEGFRNRRPWRGQRGLKPEVDHHHQGINSRSRSDAIDRILTHRLLAMPIFLVVMFLVFHLTFGQSLFGITGLPSPGVLMQDIVRAAISALQAALYQLLGTDSWLSSLINEGIIGGVGTVLTFVPQIILLFFFLSLMEDCGYMARAAFIMDRLLRRFGLSGKSFLPMLMGFGCTVPAVMAARTMENPVERRLTLMLVPFMSCGARTPIYLVMAGAFFPSIADLVVFGLYLTGIVVAVLSGILLRKMLFKGDVTPFIIELPRYRAPQMRSMLMMLWEKLKDFLVRAGTIIFAMCVVLWLLSNFGIVANRLQMCDMESSFLVAFGQFIAPVFAPLGFGFWIAAVAILTGFVAKESVISTLGTLLGIGSAAALEGGNLSVEALSAVGFTPLSALSFMVFCLLYVPCVAAFASLKREFASWRWALGQAGYSIATAYICAFLVYQIGSLLIG